MPATRRQKRQKRRKTQKGGVLPRRSARLQKTSQIVPAKVVPKKPDTQQWLKLVENLKDGDPQLDTFYMNILYTFGSSMFIKEFGTYIAKDQGRVPEVFIPDEGSHLQQLIQIKSKKTPTFSGVIFDGAHWKGYEAEAEYDSYQKNIQSPGTNNFCQSYAIFLWATRGALSLTLDGRIFTLNPGQYSDNIKVMCSLWSHCINIWRSNPQLFKQLNNDILEDDRIQKPFTMDILQGSLDLVSSNTYLATVLSNSME